MRETKQSIQGIDDTLRLVRALGRRQAREAKNCFWIEGVRHFVQAVDARWKCETIIYSPILLTNPLAEMLVRKLTAAGVPRLRVTPEQFRSVSAAERVSGIGAIVRQRWMSLEDAEPARGLCWLVIEEIRSPGNLGTILRTAEACGVGGVVFVGPKPDPFDATVLRGSMGGVFHLPLVRTTPQRFAAWTAKHGMQLVGLSPDADRWWTDLPSNSAMGLVIGEERTGLSHAMRALCQTTVRLPMTGSADSLNVGVAAGVMLYELVRRRRQIV